MPVGTPLPASNPDARPKPTLKVSQELLQQRFGTQTLQPILNATKFNLWDGITPVESPEQYYLPARLAITPKAPVDAHLLLQLLLLVKNYFSITFRAQLRLESHPRPHFGAT